MISTNKPTGPIGSEYLRIDLLGRFGKIPGGTPSSNTSPLQRDGIPALNVWCCFFDRPTRTLWIGNRIIPECQSPASITWEIMEMDQVTERHRVEPGKIQTKIFSQFLDAGMRKLEGDFVIKPAEGRLVNRDNLVKASLDNMPIANAKRNGLDHQQPVYPTEPENPHPFRDVLDCLRRVKRALRKPPLP